MPLSQKQGRQLNRSGGDAPAVDHGELALIIAEANRIFGFDGWDSWTVVTECAWKSKGPDGFHAVYIAKVRVVVRAGDTLVQREGHGTGEIKAATPGDAHAGALKAAEAEATRRVFATFGRRFGLNLPSRPKGLGKIRARRPKAIVGDTRGGPREAIVSTATSDPQATSGDPTGAAPALNGGQLASTADTASLFADGASQDRVTLLRRKVVETGHIDKSELPIGEPKRRRDASHLQFVARHPCLVCGRVPPQAHHLRYIQPRALGRKVSDEFTVPLCGLHHSEIHRTGNERTWWSGRGIDPEPEAERLWREHRGGPAPPI